MGLMMNRIPCTVVHYSDPSPLASVGGVQTFALNLRRIFENVVYMTPGEMDVEYVRARRTPVICDNQFVVDWPEDVTTIGFQHGVAAVKARATRSLGRLWLARRQKRAARRRNTIWVANSQWVSEEFARLSGNGASHVIYYPVDVDEFDGRLKNEGSKLILHDGRTRHKGRKPMAILSEAFPEWRIEPIDRPHDQVADRMRAARAFVHLSMYEGNSIVCNEAMAMNLPCMFTRVGLFRDRNRPADPFIVEVDDAYGSRDRLVKAFSEFLATLDSREYAPRRWTLEHATLDVAAAAWRQVMLDYQTRSGWDLGLPAE